jgi:hypothetical protein
MENRKGSLICVRRPARQTLFIFYFVCSILLVSEGCGAPGEPTPPSPPVPQAILDLAAKQCGDGVLLTFTMPGKGTLGERLAEAPAFEVLRGSQRGDGTPDPRSFRVVDTVPGALVPRYLQRGQVQFVDPVSPSDAQWRSGNPVLYRVRTFISAKHPSLNSQDVTLRLYPVAEAVASLEATVTEQGIQLKWPAPARLSSGEALAGVKEYRIYRGELNSGSGAAATQPAQSPWKSPLEQLGTSTSSDYLDSGFDYGKTYAYVVRSVVDSPAGPLESNDSPQGVVTPKDIFPPAAPQGVVAAIEHGSAADSVLVELSWSINVEPDLAGYRVYRSGTESAKGALLTPSLLPSPVYRDNSVESGQQYWYTVTAVDQSGNESAPSQPVAVEVVQLSR